jgi:hypothetical protein
MHRSLLALVLVAGCFAGASSDQDRIRRSLAQSPAMVNPAITGVVDHTQGGNWDSAFMMISYAPDRACFLVEWNVPEDLAPSLRFKLAGWRSTKETTDTAPFRASNSVEVLDAKTLATVKHYDVHVGGRSALVVERPDKEQAMYHTAMRVCFPDVAVVLANAQYLLITVDADARHRTAAGWRLVPARSAAR